MIKIKRVYDKIDIHDGTRILVDRLWPRGVRRSSANIDLWLKNVGPSDDLRKWFSHEPDKWPEFKKRYINELKTNPVFDKLLDIAMTTDPITLLYATKDPEKNNAAVLMEQLEIKIKKFKSLTNPEK